MKIMIIEDDFIIAEKLKTALIKWSYDVYIVEDFSDIIAAFKKQNPQLILLDIKLPFYNGYYWCAEIRKTSNIPIVFISSKSDDLDIITAMQFGADDFISKPINMDLLIAKIQAILRRTYDFDLKSNLLEFADVTYMVAEGKIIYKDREIELTKTEMMIADSLFRAKGKLVSKSKIMERCWNGDNFIDDNTLAVNMTRFRKKIKSLGLNNFIMTKKGVGYYINKDGEDIEKV